MSSTTTTSMIEVELFNEISLEHIVQLTYDEQILSKNFTTIIKILKELKNGYDGLKIENDKRTQQIHIEREKNFQQDQLLDGLKQENANLRNDLTKFEGENSNFGTDLKRIIERLDEQQKVTSGHGNQLKAHKNDIEWIKGQLDNLRGSVQQLKDMSGQYVKIADYTIKIRELQDRIKALEDEVRDRIRAVEKEIQRVENLHQQNLERTDAQLSRLDEQKFDKIQINQIERDINELRVLINNLGNSQGDQPVTVPVKDPETDRMIRDLTDRLEKLEKELDELKQKLKALENRLNEMENRPSTVQQVSSGPAVMPKEFDDLQDRVKVLENHNKSHLKRLEGHDQNLDKHQVEIDQLKKMMEHINLQMMGLKGNGDGITEEMLKERLNALRNELLSRLKQMKREIEKFVKLEKLNEELTLLLQKLADKEETKRGFYFIEKKINEINNMVLFMMNEHDNGEDPLGAKRPLWSCLSCDQDFPGYKARLGEFQQWSKLPARGNSPEKMTIFGKGFINEKNRKQEQFMKTSMFGWSSDAAQTAASGSAQPFSSSKGQRSTMDKSKSQVKLESINKNQSPN